MCWPLGRFTAKHAANLWEKALGFRYVLLHSSVVLVMGMYCLSYQKGFSGQSIGVCYEAIFSLY